MIMIDFRNKGIMIQQPEYLEQKGSLIKLTDQPLQVYIH